MKKSIFEISIFMNVLFVLLFASGDASLVNYDLPDDSLNMFGSLYSAEIPQTNTEQEIPQGIFKYELFFAEFGGRMENSECKVIIKGNTITIEQTEKTNLTGGKEIFSGLIIKHKRGQWILTERMEDADADEIGGCTEIPIIYFDKKLIE